VVLIGAREHVNCFDHGFKCFARHDDGTPFSLQLRSANDLSLVPMNYITKKSICNRSYNSNLHKHDVCGYRMGSLFVPI